jgi:hypothetical protein
MDKPTPYELLGVAFIAASGLLFLLEAVGGSDALTVYAVAAFILGDLVFLTNWLRKKQSH